MIETGQRLEEPARTAVHRPVTRRLTHRISALLVVLGVAVSSLIAIEVAFIRGDRSSARAIDHDDPPTAVARDDPQSVALQPGLARSRGTPPRTGSDSGRSDPPLPPGPISLQMTPEEATKFLVDRELKQLERSGPASAALTADALQAVDGLKRVPALAGAEFSDFNCFGSGCAVSIASRSGAGSDAIVRSRPYRLWSGPKFVSGPLPLASGETQTVLVLHTSERGQAPP